MEVVTVFKIDGRVRLPPASEPGRAGNPFRRVTVAWVPQAVNASVRPEGAVLSNKKGNAISPQLRRSAAQCQRQKAAAGGDGEFWARLWRRGVTGGVVLEGATAALRIKSQPPRAHSE